MLKTTLVLILGLFLYPCLNGQNQIPDGDFENWSNDPLNIYQSPASGWWASLNPLRTLGGPVSVKKDSDAHSGSYSALLETYQYGTLLVPGILLSGTFNLLNAPNYFTRGRPYTDRPTTFSGWYKFNSVQGDSSAIAVQLTKWNPTTLQRDTVGEVGIVILQSTSTWTEFVLPIVYNNQDTPDTLVVVATSSAGADQFLGQVGSQLWVDDFDLDVTATATSPEMEAPDVEFFTGTDQAWHLRVGNLPVELQVLDANGKLLLNRAFRPGEHVLATDNLPGGLYLIRLSDKDGRGSVQRVILTH